MRADNEQLKSRMTRVESRLESVAESVASLKMKLHEECQKRVRDQPQADHTIFQPVSNDSVQLGGPFSEVNLFIVKSVSKLNSVEKHEPQNDAQVCLFLFRYIQRRMNPQLLSLLEGIDSHIPRTVKTVKLCR